MKLDQLIDLVLGCVFRKYFALFGGLGFKRRRFLVYPPTVINQKPVMMSF